ncbi:MAG: ATP-dependent Clp protease adapter ClpS [Nitrospirae bacterium]|nr:MAG: ATP-dependent Clp protease adapter ClpS [Nitrospirota bacterium]
MSGPKQRTAEETGIKERRKTATPPLYKVFLLNDDYTTMDFVVQVLEQVFHKNPVEATQIMLYVHKKGRGLAGVYERQIAEAKIVAVHKHAEDNGFPLKCDMEKE